MTKYCNKRFYCDLNGRRWWRCFRPTTRWWQAGRMQWLGTVVVRVNWRCRQLSAVSCRWPAAERWITPHKHTMDAF